MTPMSDYQKAVTALDALARKGQELCGRATVASEAISAGRHESVLFFSEMVLESAKAVTFWAEQLETHQAALIAGPQKAADNG